MRWLSEPYRIFFPLGLLCLLVGAGVWLPQMWEPGMDYPVELHRYLMLNGFVSCFIAGFLMSAIPRLSQTSTASGIEVGAFLAITLLGLTSFLLGHQQLMALCSSAQALTLLVFYARRILQRKISLPFSFVLVPVGLSLWIASGVLLFLGEDLGLPLHYEGVIAAIILGFGSRLVPGILGTQPTIPGATTQVRWPFWILMIAFIATAMGDSDAMVVLHSFSAIGIVLGYWKIWKLPVERTSLTWSLWLTGHFITLSFLQRALWPDAGIHGSHAFFVNGIVLLALLIGIRVIQSHEPKKKELENRKVIYVLTFLSLLTATTRVSAYFLPEQYLSHLGYSALILELIVILWLVFFGRYFF